MSNNQNNKKTKQLAVLIVRNQYIFPRFNASIGVGRKASINALRYAYEHKMSEIILVNQTDPDQENPTAHDVYEYGVIVKVKLKADIVEKTSVDLKVESLHRVRLSNLKMHKTTVEEACFIAEAEILDPLKSMSAAEIRSIGEIIEAVPAKITELLGIKKANDDKINLVDDAHDKLSFLSFLLDGMVQHNEDSMKPFEKQHFLELFALNDRVNFILKEKPNLLMM